MNACDRITIGNRINDLIVDEGHFNAVADTTIGANALHKIISGEKYPTVTQLALISKALNVSVDYLMFGEHEEEVEVTAPKNVYIPTPLANAVEEFISGKETRMVYMPEVFASALIKMLETETAEQAMEVLETNADNVGVCHDILVKTAEVETEMYATLDKCDCDCNCDGNCENCTNDCEYTDEPEDECCGCDCGDCECGDCDCGEHEEAKKADEKADDDNECAGCPLFKTCFGMTEDEYRHREQLRKEQIDRENNKMFFQNPIEYIIARAMLREMFDI